MLHECCSNRGPAFLSLPRHHVCTPSHINPQTRRIFPQLSAVRLIWVGSKKSEWTFHTCITRNFQEPLLQFLQFSKRPNNLRYLSANQHNTHAKQNWNLIFFGTKADCQTSLVTFLFLKVPVKGVGIGKQSIVDYSGELDAGCLIQYSNLVDATGKFQMVEG